VADSAVYRGAISWQQSQSVMFYAQAAEGFRGGFGRFALPSACAAQAEQLGASIAEGEVRPDKLWNYETGVKSNWLQNRLRVNFSIYQINWTNVQQDIFLNCGFPLLENLGSVINRGAELEIEGRLTTAITGGASVGYVHSALQQDIFGVPGTKGLPLPDVPETTVGAHFEYNSTVFGSWDGTARVDYAYTGPSIATYTAGSSLAPNKGSLSLLGGRLSLQRSNLELALYGRNLLNRIALTALEQDVSLDVPNRLRYSVNTPRTVGISFLYRH
jgi:iron complex outermembrane recepter protein